MMNIREFGYRYLAALAGATPAFTRAAAEEHRGFGYRYLTALAGTTPAFTGLPGDQYRDRGDAPEATTTVYYFDRGGDYGGFSRGFSGIDLSGVRAGGVLLCPPPRRHWARLAQVAAVVCVVIATVVLLPLFLNARSEYQQAVVLANAAEARLTALAPTEYAGGVGAAGVVRVWNSSGEVVGTFSVPAAQSTAMTLAPDGGTVAIAGGPTVTLFDRSGRSLATAEAGAAVTSMAFSPDGTALAIATAESTQLWDSAVRQLRRQLHGQVGMVTAMAFSPDGRGLATASTDDTVRIWDIATGQQTGRHLGAMTSMAYSPDGRHLATAGAGEEVYVWDARTLQQVATLHTGFDPVSSLAYSPDGKTIRVTGVRAGKVELKKID
ncbi:WD40 repeat domain-containing protein [Nocardia gipuzkoensis]|uniref:WD40 repeat domain-containing protein n=1 Tax=Nocardia gipuzkoensis TaxID=2749991 RepID=UPI0015EE8F18|nr:hypothetical protein [Nocardia gipuzkoensis]